MTSYNVIMHFILTGPRLEVSLSTLFLAGLVLVQLILWIWCPLEASCAICFYIWLIAVMLKQSLRSFAIVILNSLTVRVWECYSRNFLPSRILLGFVFLYFIFLWLCFNDHCMFLFCRFVHSNDYYTSSQYPLVSANLPYNIFYIRIYINIK